MVLFTITPSIVEGLKARNEMPPSAETSDEKSSFEDAAVGSPISHEQIVDLWKHLKAKRDGNCHLEDLLRGSRVYVPPPAPKPEPSNEYKALMARLRFEEEKRAYERMTNPTPATETFTQRFPTSGMAQAFAEVNRPTTKADMGDDDVTYNDVHRQLMLILNFVVSILGVAGTLWVLARWWPTPARLFLTMGGSIAVGIAEVALYGGYIWHLGDAKKKEKKFKEVKQVIQTWVVGMEGDNEETKDDQVKKDDQVLSSATGADSEQNNLRRRKAEPS